ncbi:OLC1v1002520C1 [Oldenlandia corymbosa var. corymbosa]|uniref:OLC1v1002520C1 n=1 Tax=Oldenlandia corymbosa var. corymbosa TaxID=529605 RepID=A0AAV1D802_OLDCO|nr:OLC1v1002520C1 [Oldenlandia corymbosa var. corymbosa]
MDASCRFQERPTFFVSKGSNPDCQPFKIVLSSRTVSSTVRQPSHCVLIPALSTLENIAKIGNDSQRQCRIEFGVLHRLRSLLNTGDEIHVKERACLIISAIAAGNAKQTKAVIDAELIEPLMSLLKDEESDLKEVAGQAVKDRTLFWNS